MTIQLLLTSDGKKMGKTQAGAVWLDPEKTSPYEFFQYWRNIDDSDVINCLKKLTDLSLDEISAMESWEGQKLNEAKEILAYRLTMLVHGEEEAEKALSAARALFQKGTLSENMPQTVLDKSNIPDEGIDIISLLVESGVCTSRSDARRQIQQNAISVDDEKIEDMELRYNVKELEEGIVIKKGKKTFMRVSIE